MAMVVHGKQPNHMAVTAAASKLSPQTEIRLPGGFSIVNNAMIGEWSSDVS